MRSTSRSATAEHGAAQLDGATIAAYDFDLPDSLIATVPAAERAESRLMWLPAAGGLEHRGFSELPVLLRPGDLLVRNAARVLPARLVGRKPTGGEVELLVLEPVEGSFHAPGPTRFRALGRASKALVRGIRVELGPGEAVEVVERLPGGEVMATTVGSATLMELLERHGQMPLPPYIRRARTQRGEAVAAELDRERYQTVYAAEPGAIAAPTAGLHFTEAVLRSLDERGVEVADLTLHVGAGTFKPIEVERLDDVVLHRERYHLPAASAERINDARDEGRRIVAVGTTAFRALEDQAARSGRAVAGDYETALFVRPGSPIRWVGALVTNFHLPRSSLLVLVSTFAGPRRIREAYAEAIAHGYRFYSYGDAMLLERS